MADRGVSQRRIRLARDWYDAAAMNDWKPARRKAEIGLDGYPVQKAADSR